MFLIYIFYWSIVDLQCFRRTEMWFSCTYMHILFFRLFSIKGLLYSTGKCSQYLVHDQFFTKDPSQATKVWGYVKLSLYIRKMLLGTGFCVCDIVKHWISTVNTWKKPFPEDFAFPSVTEYIALTSTLDINHPFLLHILGA